LLHRVDNRIHAYSTKNRPVSASAEVLANKVVYMSGYLEHNGESHELLEDGVFLEKPFTRESLLSKVNEAFRSTSLANFKS